LKGATSFSSSFKFGAGLASKNKGQTTSDALVRGASSDEEESTSEITSLGTERKRESQATKFLYFLYCNRQFQHSLDWHLQTKFSSFFSIKIVLA